MTQHLDKKRIVIFLILAYAIAWIGALVIALTGGLQYSRVIIPGTAITFAVMMLSVGYMGAPALAHLLTRIITREGWGDLSLRPDLKRGWRYWLIAWIGPVVISAIGIVAYFLMFPGSFDTELIVLQDLMAQSGAPLTVNPWIVVISQTATAVLIAPFVNSLFTFGEEFGWRSYLLNKLRPIGECKAALWVGLIWGIWHWPLIAMGQNYGFGYWGAPWTGMLAMVMFTTVVGIFLSWVTLRGGSVWPAVIGHAAINGIASLGVLFVTGKTRPLLGPSPLGVIGAAGWIIAALWLLLNAKALHGAEPIVDITESVAE